MREWKLREVSQPAQNLTGHSGTDRVWTQAIWPQCPCFYSPTMLHWHFILDIGHQYVYQEAYGMKNNYHLFSSGALGLFVYRQSPVLRGKSWDICELKSILWTYE